MQKNSSKDLSWVKNIGWKSLQVSLAGGERRERREMMGQPHRGAPRRDDGKHSWLKP